LETSLYDAALNNVRASRLTDLELLYAPSQIALAAFSLILPDVAAQWVASKSHTEASSLSKILDDIKTTITSQGNPPSVESVREVDRRLRLCKNPEKVVGSKAYLARKTDEEKTATEKRNKKAAEVQRAMQNADPFGNEIGEKRGLVDYDDDDDD